MSKVIAMEKKEIIILQELLSKLYSIITINGKVDSFTVTAHNSRYAVPILKGLIDELNSQESETISLLDIKEQYDSMYPPKSGLSEFYVWSDDINTRKKVNDSFQKLHKEIVLLINKNL